MRDKRRNRETGIALVLALLSLMLLTFLGLALAATTSTELQIANNYRWAQQAFYNAEAGIEVAKHVLGGVTDWSTVLPPSRGTTAWNPNIAPSSLPTPETGTRDYEYRACDARGGGMGYGLVLRGDITYNNVNTVTVSGTDLTLRGGFTVWVRRAAVPETVLNSKGVPEMTGLYVDAEGDENLVVTSEGVAPFTSTAAGLIAERHQAVRTIEVTFSRDAGLNADECDFMDPEGAGFAKCYPGDDGAIGADGDSSIR